MSGIAGILFFEDSGALHHVKTMAESLKHRGPDGLHFWNNESNHVALCHLAMHTFRNSLNESKVLVWNNFSVVSDARLDNRESLIQQLFPESVTTIEALSDSEIILRAYIKWGNKCADKFLGDFAFAIYDSLNSQIFFGRDVMGVRPLYYFHKKGKFLAFGSEIKALLALEFVKTGLNHEMVALYLCKARDFRPYKGDTFYKYIQGVKPAFCYTCNSQGIESFFYWDLNLSRFDHLTNDEEFISTFREIFIDSVNCRIDSPGKIASHLSGGLDSSSVSAVAAKTLAKDGKSLFTFHMDVEEVQCDEKRYAKDVIKNYPNIVNKYVKASSNDFFDTSLYFSEMTSHPPYYALTPQAQIGWMKGAKEADCKVFLTGTEGDTVVDYGDSYMLDALQEEDWKTFEKTLFQFSVHALNFRYLDDISLLSPQEKLDFIRFNVVSGVLGHYRASGHYKKLASYFISSRRSIHILPHYFKKLKLKLKFRSALERHEVLKKSFLLKHKIETAEAQDLRLFFKDFPVPDYCRSHFQRVYCYGMTKFCEILENNGIYHGFKVAHPFLDRRLIELSLVMPKRINFNSGYERGSMREAMQGILPESVRLRTDKVDFTPFLATTLSLIHVEFDTILNRALKKHPYLNEILNAHNIKRKLRISVNPKEKQATKDKVYFSLLRVIYFIIFFDNLKKQFQS